MIVMAIFLGCRDKDKDGKPLDTPTSGGITIAVDESLRPIVDAEIAAFMAIYKNAEIKAVYGSETASINSLLHDSVRLAIVNRPMLAQEVSVMKGQRISPSTVKVGTGAIALIVNKDNPDVSISLDQLRALFRGQVDQWNQIDSGSTLGAIKIIFDHDHAHSIRYMKDSLAKVPRLPANCYAVSSNGQVMDYVSRNKGALGIIGVSWISDNDDSETLGFLKSIQVMALSGKGKTADHRFYKPYQAYIAQGLYPLTHPVYIISREARTGLGSGFMSFVAGEKGQRVILKAGLVPATMPVRVIQFDDRDIRYNGSD